MTAVAGDVARRRGGGLHATEGRAGATETPVVDVLIRVLFGLDLLETFHSADCTQQFAAGVDTSAVLGGYRH